MLLIFFFFNFSYFKGNLIMQLTVKGVLPDGFVRYRMYIFHFYTVILHIITMVVPLVKIYMSELEEKDDKVYIYYIYSFFFFFFFIFFLLMLY